MTGDLILVKARTKRNKNTIVGFTGHFQRINVRFKLCFIQFFSEIEKFLEALNQFQLTARMTGKYLLFMIVVILLMNIHGYITFHQLLVEGHEGVKIFFNSYSEL